VWRTRPPGEGPLVLGHRGASARATENTAEAFGQARADGADGVELDVMLCASGEPVVFHDYDLRRLAGRPERIAAMPHRLLREVRLSPGGAIPTLEEAFAACGPDLLVNVELKVNEIDPRGTTALVDAVASVVRRLAVGPRVLVSSFNPWAVWVWSRRVPEVPAGLLFERSSALPLRRAWLAPALRPFALHPEQVLCTPARVAGWKRRGYRVNVWTVDDPAALAACRRMGVDAVITNDPARARAALNAV
jgi:glycerophosphoryl diester phosphodiesterase